MTKGIFTALFRNINLPFLASILLLGACSKDEGGRQTLPEGEYPMTFTAAGIALNVETRATTDNNWQGVQTVAVQVDGEMKPYTVQADATDGYATATLSSDDPFYWQNTAPIQVSAWWPYTEGSTDMPAVVVQADQSEEDNFHKSDYICALDQTVEFGGTQALQFTHRTAKVVVNPLQPGTDQGMTAGELEGATIALIGVTTGNEADGNTVTPLPEQHRPAAPADHRGRRAFHPNLPRQRHHLLLQVSRDHRTKSGLPIHLYHHRQQDQPRHEQRRRHQLGQGRRDCGRGRASHRLYRGRRRLLHRLYRRGHAALDCRKTSRWAAPWPTTST